MIQVIRHKCCNKIYAASIEPHCYTDKEWMKDVRKAALQGDKIEMIESGTNWKFEKCACKEEAIQDKNQTVLF